MDCSRDETSNVFRNRVVAFLGNLPYLKEGFSNCSQFHAASVFVSVMVLRSLEHHPKSPPVLAL